jgi:negative regulator of replication initiation
MELEEVVNNQAIRDRIKLVFTLLSDGHFQCASRAIQADSMLEKNCSGLAANSMRYAKRELEAQETRIRFASDELSVLIEALK